MNHEKRGAIEPMSGKKKTTRSRRGRPREIDPQEVARIALDLFEQRGMEQVTMKEIAEAASVSRRTLFRLFPSKGDLVWNGIWEVLEQTKERIAVFSSQNISFAELVEKLVVPGLALLSEPGLAALAKRRLRLVAASPALFDHPALHEMRSLLATTIRTYVTPQQAPPELLATSLVSVAMASALWWATSNDEISAAEALQSTFAAFADVHASSRSQTKEPEL